MSPPRGRSRCVSRRVVPSPSGVRVTSTTVEPGGTSTSPTSNPQVKTILCGGIDFEKFAANDLFAIRIETEDSTGPRIDVESPSHPAQEFVVLAQETKYLLWARFDVNLFEKWFVVDLVLPQHYSILRLTICDYFAGRPQSYRCRELRLFRRCCVNIRGEILASRSDFKFDSNFAVTELSICQAILIVRKLNRVDSRELHLVVDHMTFIVKVVCPETLVLRIHNHEIVMRKSAASVCRRIVSTALSNKHLLVQVEDKRILPGSMSWIARAFADPFAHKELNLLPWVPVTSDACTGFRAAGHTGDQHRKDEEFAHSSLSPEA